MERSKSGTKEKKSPDSLNEGILTYNRYTQREFKLKFGALLEANDAKYTENSKKITFRNNIHIITVLPGVMCRSICKVKSSMARSLPVENLLPQKVGSIINYLQ